MVIVTISSALLLNFEYVEYIKYMIEVIENILNSICKRPPVKFSKIIKKTGNDNLSPGIINSSEKMIVGIL